MTQTTETFLNRALIAYTRYANGRRKGMMVAFVPADDDSCFLMGYALCNKKDKFNRARGLSIAMQRAAKWRDQENTIKVPMSMKKDIKVFVERCTKYFKDKKTSQSFDLD